MPPQTTDEMVKHLRSLPKDQRNPYLDTLTPQQKGDIVTFLRSRPRSSGAAGPVSSASPFTPAQQKILAEAKTAREQRRQQGLPPLRVTLRPEPEAGGPPVMVPTLGGYERGGERVAPGYQVPELNAEPPGVLTRLGESLAIPSGEELTRMKQAALPQTPGEWVTFVQSPGAKLAANMLAGYGVNLYELGGQALNEAYEAGQNVGEGGPLGPNIRKGAAGFADFLLRGIAGPLGGGSIMAWGEDYASGNVSGAVGDAVGVLINALMLKGALPLSERRGLMGGATQSDKIAFAARLAKEPDVFAKLKDIMPDIQSASKGKVPLTLGELKDTVNRAKDGINNEIGQAMFQVRGQQFQPQGIANRVKSLIYPGMSKTPEGAVQEQALKNAALPYETQVWDGEELRAKRKALYDELEKIRKMNPADRASYRLGHLDLAAIEQIYNGINDILYPAMDQALGRPPGYFAERGRHLSHMIDLQGVLTNEEKALAAESAAIRGSPRFSEKNLSMYGSGSVEHPLGFSLHRLNPFKPNPLGVSNKAVRRAFSDRTFFRTPVPRAGVITYPLREALKERVEQRKTKPAAQQIRDMRKIIRRDQEKPSANPNMPIGPE